MNLASTLVYAYGTSEGLSKAWDTRGRGRKVASNDAEKVRVFYHGTVLPSAKKIIQEGLKPQPSKAFQVNMIPTSRRGYVYITNMEAEARAFAEARLEYDKAPPGGSFRVQGFEMNKREEAQKPTIDAFTAVPAVVEVDIPEKMASNLEVDPDQDPDAHAYAFLNKGIIPKEYIKKVSVMIPADPKANERKVTWKDFKPEECCDVAAAKSRNMYLVYFGPMEALKMHLNAGQ